MSRGGKLKARRERVIGNLMREYAYHRRRRKKTALFATTQTERCLNTKISRALWAARKEAA